jgi:ABC-type glutathione transport system ATPase component
MGSLTMKHEQAFRPGDVPLLRASGVNKKYVERAPFSRRKFAVEALKDAQLDIHANAMNALIGASGSGKSTLASCLAMFETPDSGEILFDGQEITHCGRSELRALRPLIQMVVQDSAGALNPRFTAAQVIAEPLQIQRRASGHELYQRVQDLMEEVGLAPDSASRSSREFSGGQRQRLAIARAIALEPKLLILDESLSSLDLVTQSQILDLLLALGARHSITFLLISHDLRLVGDVADFVGVMHKGAVVEQGSRSSVLGSPSHNTTIQLMNFLREREMGFEKALAGAPR